MAKSSFTSGEAARMCGLGLSTIKRWVRKGALRAYRTPGGDLRIRQTDLYDFMRRFEIPLSENALPETTKRLVVAVDDPEIRTEILSALESVDGLETVVAAGELELGVAVSLNAPDYIIISGADEPSQRQRCFTLREAIRPSAVRIALVTGATEAISDFNPHGPEVIESCTAENGWVDRMLDNLIPEWGKMTSASGLKRKAG